MLTINIAPYLFYTGGHYHAVLMPKSGSFSLSANGETEEEAVKNLQLLIDKENEKAQEHNRLRSFKNKETLHKNETAKECEINGT